MLELVKKNKGWLKVVGSKLLEYAGVALLIWGYWLPKNKELMDERAFKAVETYNKIHNKSTKGFRQIFSEGTGIPIGKVAYVFIDWYKEDEAFKKDVDSIMPHIQDELETISPRLIVRDGKERWLHTDGEEYRVKRDDNGFGWIFVDPEWVLIYR
jgi:hypothetical protein